MTVSHVSGTLDDAMRCYGLLYFLTLTPKLVNLNATICKILKGPNTEKGV